MTFNDFKAYRRTIEPIMKLRKWRTRRQEKTLSNAKFLLMLATFFLLGSLRCHAYTEADAIKAIIGEAEGEGFDGMTAVACAIRNRGTLKGVYGLHAPRVVKKQYGPLSEAEAGMSWESSRDIYICNHLIHGAQFWEGTAFKTPYWARSMTTTAVIGHQRFFRKD